MKEPSTNRTPIDDIEPLEERDHGELGKHVVRVLTWILQGNSLSGIGIRATVAGNYLGITDNNGATLEQIGGEEFTRQYVDKAAVDFRDTFGLPNPHSKTDEHRKALKSAKRLKPRQYHVNAITKLAHGLN